MPKIYHKLIYYSKYATPEKKSTLPRANYALNLFIPGTVGIFEFYLLYFRRAQKERGRM